jgi:CubicO group peptidase (beta-lactamase class C family)
MKTVLNADSLAADLVPLPVASVLTGSWPAEQWERAAPLVSGEDRLVTLTDGLFDLSEPQGVTYAVLVIQGGRLVFERYAAGANAMYLQYSWSMAKSITHALVGILVGEGRLDIYAPAAVPEWQASDDPRRHITLDQLLRMSSGLAFNEDYVDGQVSDVIAMLFGEGRHDVGAFAAAHPLAHDPGTAWSYSSGTTNIICRLLADVVGGGPTGMLGLMREALFEPIGMTSPLPKFDGAGTFIGSSFCLATPEDFARFGLLYLRDGVCDRRRILPEGWVDYGRSPTYADAEQCYGAHWWMVPGTPWFYAGGYDGQRILIVPEKDLVVVRCGRTPADEIEPIWRMVHELVELF